MCQVSAVIENNFIRTKKDNRVNSQTKDLEQEKEIQLNAGLRQKDE